MNLKNKALNAYRTQQNKFPPIKNKAVDIQVGPPEIRITPRLEIVPENPLAPTLYNEEYRKIKRNRRPAWVNPFMLLCGRMLVGVFILSWLYLAATL